MHLLLIEDNLNLPTDVGQFMESRGNTVHYASGQTGSFHLAARDTYDAVILDLGPQSSDGPKLCRRLRDSALRDIPIVMLAPRASEEDKLSGFDAGADDYVTKPCSLLELQARLKVLVRRSGATRGTLQVADLRFDLRTLVIQRGPRVISLAPTGMRILEQLMRMSPGIVTRAEIERAVWRTSPPGSDAALRGHILTVRNAISSAAEPKLLYTVHGVGYRLA